MSKQIKTQHHAVGSDPMNEISHKVNPTLNHPGFDWDSQFSSL